MKEKLFGKKRVRDIFLLLEKEQLMRSKVYMGHGLGNWNPENKKQVLVLYKTESIINLEYTILEIRRAVLFIGETLKLQRWTKILFVNGLPFLDTIKNLFRVEKQFLDMKTPYVLRWVPGLLTNLKALNRTVLKKDYKKVRNLKKRLWLEANKKGILKLRKRVPNIVILLSVTEFYETAVREAITLKIPTVGIVDTDGFSSKVTYPIHGNDDSFLSLIFYLKIFSEAISLGKKNAIYKENFKSSAYLPRIRKKNLVKLWFLSAFIWSCNRQKVLVLIKQRRKKLRKILSFIFQVRRFYKKNLFSYKKKEIERKKPFKKRNVLGFEPLFIKHVFGFLKREKSFFVSPKFFRIFSPGVILNVLDGRKSKIVTKKKNVLSFGRKILKTRE